MTLEITPAKLKGGITPPPSKSQAHRLLIAAALAGGGKIENLAASQDIDATRRCLAALFAPSEGLPLLDCGESGSTLRFFIPLALALRGGGVFVGHGRLMERPQQPYFDLFDRQGISYRQEGGRLTVAGRLHAGVFPLRGDISSQFITGLLYALPLMEGDSEIVLTSPLESAGYVDLTVEVLTRFGIEIEGTYHVRGGQTYRPADAVVEADYTQAGIYFAANHMGSAVDIHGLAPQSKQGDRVIADYCAQLALPGTVTLDVSQCPDLVPALAVCAALRDGETTHMIHAARLRIKESDRLETTSEQLMRLGGQVAQGADSLTITGVSALTGGRVSACNDHRIAMMLAIAATRANGPVVLEGAQCVEKSYPRFWQDYAALGGKIREVP
ncbi:MAG: 3-phosphoshikimate 1-carboxyvinyltransferase [Oscillospiraceae bacterium]|nr:3-phosphoshikimate 1-carboxyvinyltransferase [Oscillospiraceae bacterium]